MTGSIGDTLPLELGAGAPGRQALSHSYEGYFNDFIPVITECLVIEGCCRMSTESSNKQRVEMLFDRVLNRGEDGLLDALVSPAYIEHNPVPGQAPGADGIKRKLQGLRTAFPDIRFSLEDLVAENDRVAARYHWTGTQTGSFMGRSPTGKEVTVQGMDFYRFSDGKLVEHWDSTDQLGLLKQLGMIEQVAP